MVFNLNKLKYISMLNNNNHTLKTNHTCKYYNIPVRLGLWCSMPLSTIFQLYRSSQLLVEETGENHRPVASH